MKEHDTALAFDFGGTKLAAAIVDTSNGAIIDYSACPTPKEKTAESSLSIIIGLGNRLLETNKGLSPTHIGISFGGSISRDRTRVNRSVHVEGWDQFPLVEFFSQKYGLPTFLENDANAAAIGEWAFGAGERAESMLYVQLSTGIGAGLVINGNLWRGEGYAGEFGHIKTYGCIEQCVCGQNGCLESVFAGWAIQKAGQELLRTNPSSTLLAQLCENDVTSIDARMVFDAMQKGDPGSIRIILSGVEKLGIALSNSINLLDPTKVVLGGSIMKSRTLFSEQLEQTLKKNTIRSIYSRLRIGYSFYSGKETLIGAALLNK